MSNFVSKLSRCRKLDGYAIANFGVRVEREWFSGVALEIFEYHA